MPSDAFLNYFYGFDGRISHLSYLLGILAAFALFLVPMALMWSLSGATARPPDTVALAAFLVYLLVSLAIPALAMAVKRLHDRNKSAWWLVPFFAVPAALDKLGDHLPLDTPLWWAAVATSLALLIWALIEIVFLKGTSGPNAYGEDPLATSATQNV